MTEMVAIARIETGVALARAYLDMGAVHEYAEEMGEGTVFPPIVAFRDRDRIICADGHHRLAAAALAGRAEIECDIREGDARAAILFAAGANARHGTRRSNADKRVAVLMLLRDDEWRDWTDAEIARRAVVSDRFVAGVRKKFTPNVRSKRRRHRNRYGKLAEMNVERIGERKPPPDVEPPDDEADEGPSPEERFWNSIAYYASEAVAMRALWSKELGDWRSFGLPSHVRTLVKQAAEAWQEFADEIDAVTDEAVAPEQTPTKH